MSHFTEEDLKIFKHVGLNVIISSKASFHNPSNISIGDNTRIDDFCILSAGNGGIIIGRNVHIAAYVSIIGSGKVTVSDFAGISSRVSVYSSNDDYSGEYMTGPTVNKKFTNVTSGEIFIGRHVVIGAGSIVLPNVRLEDGAIVGSLSLVKDNCEGFYLYAGVPAKKIKQRSRRLLELEKEFLKLEKLNEK
jgi:galactoside O-acetyltransferase